MFIMSEEWRTDGTEPEEVPAIGGGDLAFDELTVVVVVVDTIVDARISILEDDPCLSFTDVVVFVSTSVPKNVNC
jgi:hypothetical protein